MRKTKVKKRVRDLRPNSMRRPYKFFEFDGDVNPNDPRTAESLLYNLQRVQFSLKDTGITSRVFNNWRQQGLIPGELEEAKWAYFDFYQYLWLQLVKDLRTFGLPLEQIAKVKRYLFEDNLLKENLTAEKIEQVIQHLEEQFGRPFTQEEQQQFKDEMDVAKENGGTRAIPHLLANLIYYHFLYRSKTDLILFLDGRVTIWSEKDQNQQPNSRVGLEEPHITLPLLYYFDKFISPKTKGEFDVTLTDSITEPETKVLHALRNEINKEVTVKNTVKGNQRTIDIITKRGMEMPTAKAQEVTNSLFGNKEYSFKVKPTPTGDNAYVEIEKRKRIKSNKS